MISYELAKKLKDNGFAQKGASVFSYTNIGEKQYVQIKVWSNGSSYEIDNGLSTENTYIPTLSELIEACIDFPSRQFSLYGRDKDRWEATIINMQVFSSIQVRNYTFYGETPEEAVATLWLELNKK